MLSLLARIAKRSCLSRKGVDDLCLARVQPFSSISSAALPFRFPMIASLISRSSFPRRGTREIGFRSVTARTIDPAGDRIRHPGEVASMPSELLTASSHRSHQNRTSEHMGKSLCLPAFGGLIVRSFRFATRRRGHIARLYIRAVVSFIVST